MTTTYHDCHNHEFGEDCHVTHERGRFFRRTITHADRAVRRYQFEDHAKYGHGLVFLRLDFVFFAQEHNPQS